MTKRIIVGRVLTRRALAASKSPAVTAAAGGEAMNARCKTSSSPRTPKANRGQSPELSTRAMASWGRWIPGSAQGRGPGMTASLLLVASPLAAETLPDPLAAGWKGEKVCMLKEETAEHRLLLCSFPPGVGHERHFHAPHFGYVLEGGRMRITEKTGVREVETTRGSSWRSDGVDWHEAVNIGDTTTSYLIFEPKGR